jgi:hypothetical protein
MPRPTSFYVPYLDGDKHYDDYLPTIQAMVLL